MKFKKKCPKCEEVTMEDFCPTCGENISNVTTDAADIENTEAKQAAKKKQRAKTVLGIILLFIMALGFSILYHWLYQGPDDSTSADSSLLVNEYDPYDNLSYYTQYLHGVEGDLDDIVCYLDTIEDNGESYHMAIVENNSSYFFTGTVQLTSTRKADNKRIQVKNLAPDSYEIFYFEGEKLPQIYQVETGEFSELQYPKPQMEYGIEYDHDELEQWINVYMTNDDLSLDNVAMLAEYIYASHVVTSYLQDIKIYVYGEDAQFDLIEDVEIPKKETAAFEGELLFDAKEINLYEAELLLKQIELH